MDIGVTHFFSDLVHRFWQPEQPLVMLLGLSLWLLLRATLPPGSQYVLKQTLAFFILGLLGELGAALMDAVQWDKAAGGFFEVSLLCVGISLIRFIGLLLFRVVMPALHMQTPRILEDLTVIAGYCAWAAVRLRYAGVDLSHIVATSAVITAIVAFAMQDTLGNILGGLALHLDHSVEIGDWVVVDGLSGRVIDIRWRYTKIVTRNGEKVVMPNSQLMKNKFSVVGIYGSRNNAWRRWVWFNVGFEHPPHRVMEVVERVVREAEIANVAHEPAPNVVLMEFGAGYSRYALRYWLTDPQADDPTDSEVRAHIFYALQRAGMALAVPEEIRHIVKENESHEHLLAEREMRRRLDALAGVELFKGLAPDELKTLATHLVHAPFSQGDVITRQGSSADWLYILISGEADVWLESADGQAGEGRRLLNTLQPGSVFGEMGLMTGEPRSATVIARTDADCYSLGREGLKDILQSRPEVAEQISAILAGRQIELDKMRQDLDEAARAHRDRQQHESMLQRVRDFFRLPD